MLLSGDKCIIHISWATSAACPEAQTVELDKCRVFDNSTGQYYRLGPLAKNNDLTYYQVVWLLMYQSSRPFPSSLVPLFQIESKCETILLKMTLICMKMKLHAELIFAWKVSQLSLKQRHKTLGNGLTCYVWGHYIGDGAISILDINRSTRKLMIFLDCYFS